MAEDGYTDNPGKESEEELRSQLLWFAGEIVRAEPHSHDQHRLQQRAAEVVAGDEDIVAARRLTSRPDPGLRAAFAARDAALQTPANASVLYSLIDSFVLQGAVMEPGEGQLLRLERWLDAPFAPLTALRCSVQDAESTLEREAGEVRSELEARGFIDASDPTLPMAALWIALDHPHATTGG